MHKRLALSLALIIVPSAPVHADAALVYELNQAGAVAAQKTFSISDFFVRVDSAEEPDSYLLFQAGKFFPLYRVNQEDGTYARLTPPVQARLGPLNRTKPVAPAAESEAATASAAAAPPPASETETPPAGVPDPKQGAAAETKSEDTPAAAKGSTASAPAAPTTAGETETPPAGVPDPKQGAAAETGPADPPAAAALQDQGVKSDAPPSLPKVAKFRPTRKQDQVAGVSCRVVLELIDGKPAVEHCMANKAALSITERETRTLARLFSMARVRGYDWLGTATEDEEFVSVRSRDLARDKTLVLKSVSTQALPNGYLRVPRAFKEVEAAAPTPSPNG
jgi:hypothetical protein